MRFQFYAFVMHVTSDQQLTLCVFLFVLVINCSKKYTEAEEVVYEEDLDMGTKIDMDDTR